MSRNRVNLLKTFSLKNELLNANLLLNCDFQLFNQTNGKIKYCDHNEIRSKYMYPEAFDVENSTKIHFVQINNLNYTNGICIQLDNFDPPTFGLIKEVFLSNNEIYFGCEILLNNGFDRNYYGYSVNFSNSLEIFLSL